MCRRCPRHLDEDEGEHREHRRLDESDEDLEEEEWEWNEVRYEVEHHGEEYFSRENIPEEPEREREEFRHLTHHLQESHDRTQNIRLVQWTHEKFRRIPTETKCRDAGELDREYRDK